MKRIILYIYRVLLVLLAGWLGSITTRHVNIIPKAILRLPEVTFNTADILITMRTMAIGCALSFIASTLIYRGGVFQSPRRTAIEIYALMVGMVAASLYLFIMTSINFSPEYLLQTALIGLALFVLSYAVLHKVLGPATIHWGEKVNRFGVVGHLFDLLKSPLAWVAIVFMLSPIFVARQFSVDRDFANWITRIRVAVNVSSDHPYDLVNALGETLFETPIMAQFPDANADILYVLERNGVLYRVDYPSGANKEKLIDIRQQVGWADRENGAIGFDLHPDFGKAGSPNQGYVYIAYTEYREDGQTNHLTRFDLTLPTPQERVDKALSMMAQERNNEAYHNGGGVEFGPDGFLYVSVGEGARRECLQRLDCGLFGGILRVDVDQKGGTVSRPVTQKPINAKTAGYFIPLDNPYAANPDLLGEFYAHGLRNPFRFSFDPLTKTLWAGDVGSAVWEEVNIIKKGGNYQFPYIEGTALQVGHVKPKDLVGEEVVPVLTYPHTAYVRSVIGGIVYRGTLLPQLEGLYVFGDNYSGEIFTIPATGEKVASYKVIAKAKEVAQRGLTGFVQAPDGNILIPLMGDNDKPTGMIVKLVMADDEAAVKARAVAAENARKAAAAPLQTLTQLQKVSVFNTNCGRCHGVNGQGDGPDAEVMGFVPNFHDEAFHKWRTDEELLAVIREGGAAVGQNAAMPPWKEVLSPAEIVAMRDYVRSFRGKPVKE